MHSSSKDLVRMFAVVGAWLVLAGGNTAARSETTGRSLDVAVGDKTLVTLSFSATPELTDCRTVSRSNEGGTWDCGSYELTLTMRRERGAHLIGFLLKRKDASVFDLDGYAARVSVPYGAEDALWCYNRLADRSIMVTTLDRPFRSETAANVGVPYFVLVNRRSRTRLAMGLLSQSHRTALEGERSGDDYGLTVRQLENARGAEFRDVFYISRTRTTWFENARAYTAVVDRNRGYRPLRTPAAALDPVYDTWYWTLDQIDERLVWDLARRSQELGFKTYLLDAGWDTDPGEYFQWLDGRTGDYIPPPRSFPDLAGLLERIRNQLGMRVMLWMQQYALGRESIYYPRLAGSMSYSTDDSGDPVETATLCPRVLTTHRHLTELFGRILDEYRPDAFWFDWQEDIPAVCSAPHPHEFATFGEAYNTAQQTITDLVTSRDADAFIEMRWPYANLNNKSYAHVWQPIDSPEDFETMRLRAMNMRPFSRGVVMASDEMYWDPRVSNTDAVRFMAAVIFTGVPNFGPNLQSEPRARQDILRAWLSFYGSHRDDLVKGDFSPYGDRDHPDQVIEGRQETFVYYGNRYTTPLQLTRSNGRFYIVNASSSPGIHLSLQGIKPGTYRIEVTDTYLRTTRSISADLKESQGLEFNVPIGGMLVLTSIP